MGHLSTPEQRLQASASALIQSGLSVLPIASRDTKAPALESWKTLTRTPATEAEAVHWFTSNGHPASPALGIVCGSVSGGLTVIDFDTLGDGTTLYPVWSGLVDDLCPGLAQGLPVVTTPSGGCHVYLRCDAVEGNAKLAESATRETWIETRGEGGYVLAPPTPGYRRLWGRLSEIPTVTIAQRDLLLNAARSLTARPPAPARLTNDTSPLPGDAYNAKATVQSVLGLFIGHGWATVRLDADHAAVRRPGKDTGLSATIRLCGGTPITYVFSTNAAPLPAGCGLSPFAVYTHLEHGGDFSQAARALGGGSIPAPGPAKAPPAQAPILPGLKRLSDLVARDMPDLPFAVPGIIPDGLFLLAGAPKTGKSLMCLGMMLGIAQGGYVLGKVKVEPRPVIYYVLEDGERLFRKRAIRMMDGRAVPDHFYYRDEFCRLDHGALDAMKADLAAVPGAVLVVDTYQRIRPMGRQGTDSYQNDANGMEGLAKWVVDAGITCVLVHHTTKAQAGDFLCDVSGSFGITGTVGNVGVLKRTRHERELKLLLSGRGYDEDQQLIIEYDPATLTHTLLGTADEVGSSHIDHIIIESLRFNQEPMTPKDLLASNPDVSIASIWARLALLLDSGQVIKTKHGHYALPGARVDGETLDTLDTLDDFPDAQAGGQGAPHSPQCDLEYLEYLESSGAEAGADAPPDGLFKGVAVARQTTPCPGCGKKYTKRPARYGAAALVCSHCGVECPNG